MRFIDRFFENIFRNNININRDDDYNRSRKTYVIDEQDEEQNEFVKDFLNYDQDESKDEIFYFENLNYYDSNYST